MTIYAKAALSFVTTAATWTLAGVTTYSTAQALYKGTARVCDMAMKAFSASKTEAEQKKARDDAEQNPGWVRIAVNFLTPEFLTCNSTRLDGSNKDLGAFAYDAVKYGAMAIAIHTAATYLGATPTTFNRMVSCISVSSVNEAINPALAFVGSKLGSLMTRSA